MTEIRRADPAARRQAVWLLMVGTLVGGLLILAFERYRRPLREWMGSDPRDAAHRIKLALVLLAVLLSAPGVAFAAYLWAFGAKVLRAQQCPPPGYLVIRDTPVVGGRAATMRGHAFQILAICLGAASLLLWLLLWRLARALATGPP
jgi:hypothetical protein